MGGGPASTGIVDPGTPDSAALMDFLQQMPTTTVQRA
jgi:hypothetical protein